MSFDAIGAELGITGAQADRIFRYAIGKLRTKTPNALAYMAVLAGDLQAERAARLRK
jgi:hypothetical protein